MTFGSCNPRGTIRLAQLRVNIIISGPVYNIALAWHMQVVVHLCHCQAI